MIIRIKSLFLSSSTLNYSHLFSFADPQMRGDTWIASVRRKIAPTKNKKHDSPYPDSADCSDFASSANKSYIGVLSMKCIAKDVIDRKESAMLHAAINA